MTAPDGSAGCPPQTAAEEVEQALTVIDLGRAPFFDGLRTDCDQGRSEPANVPERDLPPDLLARFEVLDVLARSGRQGALYRVRDRAGGCERVLKVYWPGMRMDGQVAAYLRAPHSRHVVSVDEIGEADDLQYEVMEHLPGGSVAEWVAKHPCGTAEPILVDMVRQVADGLAELHEADIVHRDVKPANLLFRSADLREVVVADFGISSHTPVGLLYVDEQNGTVPYTPPEFLGARAVGPAFDWWSLGATVFELATGHRILPDLRDNRLRVHIVSETIDVSDVTSPRVRLLCEGLLTTRSAQRWGAEEVRQWLRGESPPVARPVFASRTGEEAPGGPYLHLGREYRWRAELAGIMTREWDVTRSVLLGRDRDPLNRLHTWLATFPGLPKPEGRPGRRAPDDVRLLYELRAIDAAHPPFYRGRNISPVTLSRLADDGIQGVGVSADIIADLWHHDLLPVLAPGLPKGSEDPASPGLDAEGGNGLMDVRARWRPEHTRLVAVARAVPDRVAKAEAVRLLAESESYMLSLSLLGATAAEARRRELRSELEERAREYAVPWLSDMIARPEFHLVAYALLGLARDQWQTRRAEERAQRVREDWIRRRWRHLEWSRRQNRPRALGFAVAGVAAVAVLLFGLVALGDVIDLASDAQVVDAWLASVVALLATTLAESLLAWDAGERFHPTYSFLGAGAMVLGRVARNLLARRTAVPVVLVTLAVLAVLTVFQPAVTPFLLAGLNLVWTVQRFLAWRRQDREERARYAAV
ncbi:serine/threonine-protein kinase [Actinokineospora sp. 24-640]